MQPKAIQQDMFRGEFAYSRRPQHTNPIHRYGKDNAYAKGKKKSFEDYLVESFQGEVVQSGNNYSEKISDLMKQNLSKLR